MSLSKPIYNLLGAYLEQLFNNPIRTKCVTSAVILTSANYVSQSISGVKEINKDSLLAYGIFGLIFGGTLPHFFYTWVERVVPDDIRYRGFIQFALERLGFAPLFQAVSLYFLSRFEGNDHKFALQNMIKLYWPIIKANWRYLSLAMFINMKYVPPMLRVLVGNLIGFCWVIFVANKRRQAAAKAQSSSK